MALFNLLTLSTLLLNTVALCKQFFNLSSLGEGRFRDSNRDAMEINDHTCLGLRKGQDALYSGVKFAYCCLNRFLPLNRTSLLFSIISFP